MYNQNCNDHPWKKKTFTTKFQQVILSHSHYDDDKLIKIIPQPRDILSPKSMSYFFFILFSAATHPIIASFKLRTGSGKLKTVLIQWFILHWKSLQVKTCFLLPGSIKTWCFETTSLIEGALKTVNWRASGWDML